MKRVYTVLLACALLAASPAFAHGGEEHPSAAPSGAAEQEKDVSVLLAKLDTGLGVLEQDIAAKAFDKIHESSEGVLSVLEAIDGAAAGKAGVAATVSQLRGVLGALHTAGDAKDAQAAEQQFHKLTGGVKLLKAQL